MYAKDTEKKPRVQRVVDGVVAVILIPSDDSQDTSFELFLQRNDALIADLVGVELRRHGCASDCFQLFTNRIDLIFYVAI